jgi:hypothetical protein
MIRRTLILGLVIGGLLLTLGAPAEADDGTGEVTRSRLPWRAKTGQRQMTQGWFGHASHYSQFGEDLINRNANGIPISFKVVAATESKNQATCRPYPGPPDRSGNFVRIDRTYNNLTDWYFHLAPGACNIYPTHREQGDFLAWAGNTGTGAIHLHYEPRGPGGGPADSVEHSLSGIDNFCDHNDLGQPSNHDGEPNYQCSQAHHDEFYTSDNGGPGANLAVNRTAQSKLRAAYMNIGHFLCGQSKAWDCFGSSINFLGEGYLANRVCLGSPSDCGWNQDFMKSGGLANFNWPEACANAYWVPGNFYIGWLYNTWLGQARSSVHWEPVLGQYIQYFRHGFMLSPTFGGTPTVYASSQSACLA